MPLSQGDLEGILRGNEGATEAVDLAEQITNWYHNGVMAGADLSYGNGALTVNRGAFYSALAPAYVDVESPSIPLRLDPDRGSTGNVSVPTRSPNPSQVSVIASAHQAASIAYWTGAQLEKTIPPPGAVSVINNPVTNTGSFSVNIPKINSLSGYAGLITAAHTSHLATLSGQTISLMPDGSVQVFPWNGYN